MSCIADLEKGDSKKADDSIETDDSARVETRIDLKHNFLAWQVSIHVSQDNAYTFLPCSFIAHIQMMIHASLIQTWDLLRMMYFGFVGLCNDFTTTYPGYYIIPVRVNGSAIESLFSSLKYSARGQLSSANYMSALAAIQTAKAVKHTSTSGESSYRGQDINIQQAILQRRGKSKAQHKQ